MLDLFKVFMAEDVNDYVVPVLKSGYIGEGTISKQFEKNVCDYIGNPNGVVVNSGTSAIFLALKLAGIKKDSLVISTPMTCSATNHAILATGADIIFADVDPLSGNISCSSVETLLEQHSYIEAVVCVHWGGVPCNVERLNCVCSQRDIPVIEDACHAFGSELNSLKIGNHSEFVCFSFQAIKLLTTGDGGMLFCRHKDAAEKARLKRWFMLDRDKGNSMRCSQETYEIGYKMQLNDIAASIGCANLPHVDSNLETIRKHAMMYDSALSSNCHAHTYFTKKSVKSSYWLYTVLVEDADHFIDYMKNLDIECGKVHVRNDSKDLFRHFGRDGDMLGLKEFDDNHVCIPVGWWLTDMDVYKVCDAIRSYTYGCNDNSAS